VQVFLKARLDATVEGSPMSEIIGPFAAFILKSIPYILGCTVFTFVYVFMPNTKVRLRSGVMAGIVAGLMFQVVQWAYISFQVGVAKANAVYGSFAALPLFLAWLQVSWLVVLFGAELSFADQNVETYEFEPDCMNISHAFKRLVALKVCHLLVTRFASGERPAREGEISHELGLPMRLTSTVLYELVDAGILSATQGNDDEPGYQPARPLATLSLGYVIEALDRRGSDGIPMNPSDALDRLKESLERFAASVRQSPANVLLKDI
jgi:membrane protein